MVVQPERICRAAASLLYSDGCRRHPSPQPRQAGTEGSLMSLNDKTHDTAAAKETIKHVTLAKPKKRRPFAIATLGNYYVAAVTVKGGPKIAEATLRHMRFGSKNVPKGCKGDNVVVKACGLLHRDAHGRVVIETSEEIEHAAQVFKSLKTNYFPHLKTKWKFKAIVLRRLKDGDGGDEFADTDAEVDTPEADLEAAQSPGDDEITLIDEFGQTPAVTPTAAAAATPIATAAATPTAAAAATPIAPAAATPIAAEAVTPTAAAAATPIAAAAATSPRPQVPEVPKPPPLEIDYYLETLVEHVMRLSGVLMPDGFSEDEKQDFLASRSTKLRGLLDKAVENGTLDDTHMERLIEQIINHPKGDPFRRRLLDLPAAAEPKERYDMARSKWVPAHQDACGISNKFKDAVEEKLLEVGEVFGEGEENWDKIDRLSLQINAMSFPPFEVGEADMQGVVQRVQDVLTAQIGVLEEDQGLTDFVDNIEGDVGTVQGVLRAFREAIAESSGFVAKMAN